VLRSRFFNSNVTHAVLAAGASANIKNVVNYKYPSLSIDKIVKTVVGYETLKMLARMNRQSIESGLARTRALSPEVAAGQAEAQIMQTMANIRSAHVYGPELGELVRQRARLTTSAQGLMDPFWKGFYQQMSDVYGFGADIINVSGLINNPLYRQRAEATGSGVAMGLLSGGASFVLTAGSLFVAALLGYIELSLAAIFWPATLAGLGVGIAVGSATYAYRLATGSGSSQEWKPTLWYDIIPPMPEVPVRKIWQADPDPYGRFGHQRLNLYFP
jgi:hypothetical protein